MEKVIFFVMFMAGGDISTETVEVKTLAQCEVLKAKVTDQFETTVQSHNKKYEIWVLKAECIAVPNIEVAHELMKLYQ